MEAIIAAAVVLLLVGGVALMVRCVEDSPLMEDSDSTLWSLKQIACLAPPHRHRVRRRRHWMKA